jgi:hypothetical protein
MNTAAQTSSAVGHGDSTEVSILAAKKPFIDQTIPGFTIALNQTTYIKEKLLPFGVNMDDNPGFTVGIFLEKEIAKRGEMPKIGFARHGIPAGYVSPLINTLLDAIRSHPRTFSGHKAVIAAESETTMYYLIVDCTGKQLRFTQTTAMPEGDEFLYVVCDVAAMRAS